jgi:hypothetical protein
MISLLCCIMGVKQLCFRFLLVPYWAYKVFEYSNLFHSPIPVAARSKAWVCSRALAGIEGSNPTGGMDFFLL